MLHSELRAILSYGHPPIPSCPDEGGLSVPENCPVQGLVDLSAGEAREEFSIRFTTGMRGLTLF